MSLHERLRGGLVVSVQAEAESVLNAPEAIALLARCAMQNGAVGLRIEGEARIRAVRAALPNAPIVGIVKCVHAGFEPYITSRIEEIALVAAAGADIVAFDATQRPRAGGASVADLTVAAHAAGLAAMADCALAPDARAARAAGADLIATTLAGYTAQTAGQALPALALLAEIVRDGAFAVCEGGIGAPDAVAAAFAAGAGAVVVGTALTNIDVLVRRFAAATPRAHGASNVATARKVDGGDPLRA